MIRSTLAAVPRRLPMLWGKALVFGATAFAVSLPGDLHRLLLVGQAILSGEHINVAIGHPGVFPGADRRAPLPHRDGSLRPRPRGDGAQHGRAGSRRSPGSSSCSRRSSACWPTSVANSIDPYLPSNAGGGDLGRSRPTQARSAAPGAGFGDSSAPTVAVGDGDRRGAARATRRLIRRAYRRQAAVASPPFGRALPGKHGRSFDRKRAAQAPTGASWRAASFEADDRDHLAVADGVGVRLVTADQQGVGAGGRRIRSGASATCS